MVFMSGPVSQVTCEILNRALKWRLDLNQNATCREMASLATALFEHDLFPKTGSHPGSSPGQAF
jgi:hypothetical protein